MLSTPHSREALLRDLVSIPSVTASAEENSAALFVRDYLSKLNYFKNNPAHLEMVSTPLEGDASRPLCSVSALMRAPSGTKKTVILLAHFDVVDIGVYGELAEYAFSPDELAKRLRSVKLPASAADDLKSGGWLFGRGTADMKCGLAIEMELLRDYDHDRKMFDVNLLLAAVPDEENASCGARGMARHLAQLMEAEDIDYIACINTEPSEAGLQDAKNQLLFLGSLGKLMPAFYCRGVPTHSGNYYRGLSAALLSSNVVCAAEAASELANPNRETCQPSWICLGHGILSEGYSVTVPNRSVAYFNCFTATKTPSEVMGEMKRVAEDAAEASIHRLRDSHATLASMGYKPGMDDFTVRVITFGSIAEAAAKSCGGRDSLDRHVAEFLAKRSGDLRGLGIAVIEEMLRMAPLEPPFIAVGFLPPYNPPRTSLDGAPKSNVLARAADRIVSEAKSRFNVDMDIEEFYNGITDLSFMGFSGSKDDVTCFTDNCPIASSLFGVPFGGMMKIDVPVMNLGPCGRDAHKMTERLEVKYSLDILPNLLAFAVKTISES
ncbi:peptidase M20 [Synergistales bacterium]|nr:peptidase M20 [Synergistales bacterium]